MSDLQVELSQIDRSDLNSIKQIINSGFGLLLDDGFEFNVTDFTKWYDRIVLVNKHMFAIRVSKSETGSSSRSWLVGICGVVEVDNASRHGRLIFFMIDKDGHKSTLQNHPASRHAFNTLLKYSFKELGLNKVWMSVPSNNDISSVLDSSGFTADGIRRRSAFINGKYRDEAIFSLTMKEFMEKYK